MESFGSACVPILFKFSNASGVLRYYDGFSSCEALMMALCKKSRKTWTDYYDAFGMALEYVRKSLVYTLNFDSSISEFLLAGNRYKKYELELQCESKESYSLIIEFIESVNDLSRLQIKEIKGTVVDLTIDLYNQLCLFLIGKGIPHLSLSIVKYIISSGFTQPSGMLEYVSQSYFSNSSVPILPKRVNRLNYHFNRNYNHELGNIDCEASTILLSTSGAEDGKDIDFLSDSLKNSIHTLEVITAKPKLYKNFDYIIEYFKEKVMNYRRLVFILAVYDFDTFGIYLSNYARFSIKFGSMKLENGTIIKNYPRIYYIDKEKGDSKFIKAKRILIQYGTGGGLIFSNNEILVFKHCTYLELDDLHDNSQSKIELNTFLSTLKQFDKNLQNQSKYFVILNKDIDEIVIKQNKNANFPNPNCKKLTFYISITDKLKMISHVASLIKMIKKETEVNFVLNLSYYLQSSDIEEKLIAIESLLKLLTSGTVTTIKYKGDILKIKKIQPLYILVGENEYLKNISVVDYSRNILLRNMTEDGKASLGDCIEEYYDMHNTKKLKGRKLIDPFQLKLSSNQVFLNHILIS